MDLKRSIKLSWPILASLLLLSGLLLSGCKPARAGETTLPTPTSPATPQASLQSGELPALLPSATRQHGLLATPRPANSANLNCTYSSYYWRSNPNLWLTDNIVIGSYVYTKSDALDLLGKDSQDSTSLILKEFLTAALNILKGADPKDVELDMASASDWLNAHPPGYEISAADLNSGMELAIKLQAYNAGILGPGMCKDEPATPTPTATSTPTITPTPTRTPILPSETPTVTPTERFKPQVLPTNPPASQEPSTEPVSTEQPGGPTEAPATVPPTSAAPPTEAPPPPPTEAPPEPSTTEPASGQPTPIQPNSVPSTAGPAPAVTP